MRSLDVEEERRMQVSKKLIGFMSTPERVMLLDQYVPKEAEKTDDNIESVIKNIDMSKVKRIIIEFKE